MDITTSNFYSKTPSNECPSSRPTSVFNGTGNYKPIEWSQVTPQPMPWAQHPTFYSPVMTFGSSQFFQPSSSMSSTTQSTVFQNSFMPTPTSTSLSSFSQSISSPQIFTSPSLTTMKLHCKRKSDINALTPVKQHITEEKMAAHMSKLHISSETPIIPASTSTSGHTITAEEEPPADREKRLIMCEEMRRLQTESIIPSALMRSDEKCLMNDTSDKSSLPSSRLERPCMAVMLWQPPQRTSDGIPLPPSSATSFMTTMLDNNNDTAVNLNTTSTSRERNVSTTDEDDEDSAEIVDMDMDL